MLLLNTLAQSTLTTGDPSRPAVDIAKTSVVHAQSQDNIASFGGDPKRVVIIGQSSGGTDILSLLASPGSKGLFSAAISLSGSPNITQDLTSAEAQGEY